MVEQSRSRGRRPPGIRTTLTFALALYPTVLVPRCRKSRRADCRGRRSWNGLERRKISRQFDRLRPFPTPGCLDVLLTTYQKDRSFRLVLIRMFTNFGRDIVFSADLCYNDANEKPPSEREVARRSRDGRSLRNFGFRLTSL